MVLLGGAGVTLAAWWAAFFMAEERRLARAFRQGLGGGQPDAALISHGAGRGVALSLAAQRIVTAWDAGGWRLAYPLDALLGAELDLDGEVAALALRGEPGRRLERQSGAEREVRLRFLFDDARHPDFELVLWPPQSSRGGPARPREAIAEANRWIARTEALLRRTGGALAPGGKPAAPRPSPPPRHAPLDLDLFEEEADELAD